MNALVPYLAALHQQAMHRFIDAIDLTAEVR